MFYFYVNCPEYVNIYSIPSAGDIPYGIISKLEFFKF
jgi:hypothetical protein